MLSAYIFIILVVICLICNSYQTDPNIDLTTYVVYVACLFFLAQISLYTQRTSEMMEAGREPGGFEDALEGRGGAADDGQFSEGGESDGASEYSDSGFSDDGYDSPRDRPRKF